MDQLHIDILEKVFAFVDYKSRAQVRGTCKAFKEAVDQVGLAVHINENNGTITGLNAVKIKEAVISKMDDPEMYNFGDTKTVVFTNLINGNFFIEQLTALPKLTSLVLSHKALTSTDIDIKCKIAKVPVFQSLKFLSITLSEYDLPDKMNPYFRAAVTKRLDNNMKFLMENIHSRALETVEIKLDIFDLNVKFTWDRAPLEAFMNKHKSTLKKAYLTHPTDNPDFSKKIQLESLFLIGVGTYNAEYGALSKLATSQNKLQEFGCAEMKFHQSQSVENLYKAILTTNHATLKYFNVEVAMDDCTYGLAFDFGCFQKLTSLKFLRYKRGGPGPCKGLNKIPISVEYLTLDGFTANIDNEMLQFIDQHKDLKELKILHKIHVKPRKNCSEADQFKLLLRKIFGHPSLYQVECQFYHFPPNPSFITSDSIECLNPWINPEKMRGSGSGDELAKKLRIVELTLAPYTLPTNSANCCVYEIQPNPLTDYYDEETGHAYKSQYNEVTELSSYMSAFPLAGTKIQPHVPQFSANSFTMLKNSETGTNKIIPHYKTLYDRFSDIDNLKVRIIFDVEGKNQKKMEKTLKEYGGGDTGIMEGIMNLEIS